MDIGKPEKEIIIEPLTEPASAPKEIPVEPVVVPEPQKVPVPA